MDRDTIDLIKRTVAKGATDDELQMFVNQCDKYDLDPLANEIYFVKYPNKKDPKNPTVSIQYGINGLLKIAHKSDDYEGIIAFSVYKNDEFEAYAHDHQIFITHKFKILDRGGLIGAWAQVNRKGMKPFIKVVAMGDFYKADNFWWDTFPSDMIEKTAKKKALNDAYGISGTDTEDEEQTTPSLPASKEKPMLSPTEFIDQVNQLLPPAKDTIEQGEPIKGKPKKKKKKTSKKKVIAEKKEAKPILGVHEEKEEEKLPIDPPITVEYIKPKVEKPIFSFMKTKKGKPITKKEVMEVIEDSKLLKDIEAEVQKDLENINIKFSLEFKDTLDDETKTFKGDDWYCSSTAKAQLKKDLPLTTFIMVVTQTFPEHADAINELFKEQMKDKKRSESLLFLYYNALRDYLEIQIKEDDRGVDLLFAQRISRIINNLIKLKPTGTIEEIHALIKDATDWKDDWVKWAIKFLKEEGHI